MPETFIENCCLTVRKPAKALYNLLPDSVRLGGVFRETYRFLEAAQWWSKEQHESYQMQQIMRLIEHAYRNVPYYRRVFDEREISVKSIQNFNDLKRLPFLTREIIQHNLKDLTAANYRKKDIIGVTTGGSTSVPMGFYEERKLAERRQMAFVAHLWKRAGYDINKRNRIAILRGNPIKDFYEYNGSNLILSSYRMSNENMEEYLKCMSKFNPHFLHVYPSTVALLSDHIIEKGIRPHMPELKAILTSSEKITDYQKNRIEQAFGVRLFDLYGHAEHSSIAAECESSRLYHLTGEYGYTELIGSDGSDACMDGETGEIVCTGFNNYVMPFIRYRTGDLAVNTTEKCSCGRSCRLLKRIEGRVQEYLIDKSGSSITFTCSDDALWKVKDRISAYQYVQDLPGKVNLNIIPKPGFRRQDYETVKSDFMKFYPGFEIEIQTVGNIERTKRGKFKYLKQNIPDKNPTY